MLDFLVDLTKVYFTTADSAAGQGTPGQDPQSSRDPARPPGILRERAMKALEGRVALVTGSSRGIGQAIASEFGRQGAAVAVHGRSKDAVADVVSAIRDSGENAVGVTGDVTSFDQVEEMRRRVNDSLGPVDVLVANAGASLAPPGPLEEISEAAWRATVDANLLATFLTLKSFLPGMKQRGRGAIITIASSAGRGLTPGRRSPTAPPRPRSR